MQNASLGEAQVRIKIAGRNISNLRYTDDTKLMAESEEKLKKILIKVKEESKKVGLKLNIQFVNVVYYIDWFADIEESLHPWDSPDKNTGVGYHFLLQCMKVKKENEKAGLKLNIQKLRSWHPVPSIHGK